MRTQLLAWIAACEPFKIFVRPCAGWSWKVMGRLAWNAAMPDSLDLNMSQDANPKVPKS